jgi:FkbM family methyltransferase
MLRTIIERLSRGVVLTRRLPREFGGDAIYVSPDASLRHWRLNMRKIDPQLFALLPRIVKRGDVVWDVGANVGLFSFASAALAGRAGSVVAIEPDAWLVLLLRRSAAAASPQRAKVEVLPAAVGERVGLAQFNIARRGRAASHLAGLGRVQAGGSRETTTVVLVTLDWLLDQFPAPRVVKIDVEGAENLVIRGAKRILNEVRPVIVCEVGRMLVDEVSNALRAARYEIVDLDAEDGTPPSPERDFWNVLARPVESLTTTSR